MRNCQYLRIHKNLKDIEKQGKMKLMNFQMKHYKV